MTCWPWTGSRTRQVSPDGKWIVFNVRETDLEGQPRPDGHLARRRGRRRPAPPDDPSRGRLQRPLVPLRQVRLLPVRPGRALRRSGGSRSTGERPNRSPSSPLDVGNLVVAPAGGTLAVTMEVFPGRGPRGDGRRSSRPSRTGRPPAGSTTSSSSAIGTPGATGGARISSSSPSPGGEAQDLMPAMDADTPSKPFGGTGGDRLHAGRQGPRLHGPRRRPRGGLVHGLRPLLRRPSTAPSRPACLTEAEQGHGHGARLLAGREDPGLSGHGPARLRGRPLPHRAQALAGRGQRAS